MSETGHCTCEPVGLAEIAERLDFPRQTADNWRTRGVMPPARWTVGGRPAWSWDDIEQWAIDTGRLRVNHGTDDR